MFIQIGTFADDISVQRCWRPDVGSFYGVAYYMFQTHPGEELGQKANIARVSGFELQSFGGSS
jgi:hypothetical protein